ncbi:MAG: MFS transporter [archaeon GB-1867-005]|nr:MFS transporter [Candidatus Culexmicrobium cathedralense]
MRNLSVLLAVSLIAGIYWSLINPIYQPFALSLGVSMTLLGLLEAVRGRLGLITTLTQLFGGLLADKYGRKIMMLASSMLTMLCLALHLLAASFNSIPIFIAGSIMMGLSWLGLPAWNALTMESAGKDRRGLALSLTMFMNIVPGIIFSPIGGWLSEHYGYWSIFAIGVVMEASCFTIMLLFLSETIGRRIAEINFKDFIGSLLPKGDKLRNLYLVMTVDSFAWGLGSTLLYGFLVECYNFTNVELGLLSSIFTASWALAQIPAGKITDKYGAKATLILSELFGVLTLTLWLVAGDFTSFAVSHVIFGVSPALWIPALNTYVADRAPEGKVASTIGGLMAFRGLIAFPAPFIGGLLYDLTGYHLPIALNFIGTLTALIAIIFLL